jgi:hypothetical protein
VILHCEYQLRDLCFFEEHEQPILQKEEGTWMVVVDHPHPAISSDGGLYGRELPGHKFVGEGEDQVDIAD